MKTKWGIMAIGMALFVTGIVFNSHVTASLKNNSLAAVLEPSVTFLVPQTGNETTATPGADNTTGSQPSLEPSRTPTENQPSVTATASQINIPFQTGTPTQAVISTNTLEPFPSNTSSPVSFTATTFSTSTPTLVATSAPTNVTTSTSIPTVTETTPTTTSGDISWSVEVDVPVTNQQLAQSGGAPALKDNLQNQINSHLTHHKVKSKVDLGATSGNTSTFQVSLSGEDGLGEFRQVVFGDLNHQVDLLGGAITLDINGNVEIGKAFPLLLESNPSTGYVWKVLNYDPRLLQVTNSNDFTQKENRVGAAEVQTIHFNGIGNGTTTISLFYGRPWMGSSGVNRRVTINAGANLPKAMDMSAPAPTNSASTSPVSSLPVSPNTVSSQSVGLPVSFDWRSQGKVTAIRNQSSCGSCWAFATIGVMEAAIKIQGGGDTDLSEQYLLNCNNDGYSCSGGWWAHAYDINKYISPQTQAGAVLESSLPYTASNGTCTQPFVHPYKLTNWYSIAGDSAIPSVDQIKNAIYNYGPVAAAICVGNAFSSYTGGVFSTDESSSCTNVNHAIILTGWDDSTQTWVLRNSWGTNWGESGYMRIKYGTSRVGFSANYVVYTPAGTPTPGTTPTPLPSPTPTNTSAPLANDTFETATGTNPVNNVWKTLEDVTNATTAYDDPVYSCAGRAGYKSVWFKYTAPFTGTLAVDTIGSNYDTILGIWQGTRGNLTNIACDDDSGGNYTSKISSASVVNGQTYYLEVSGYSLFTSASLTLNLQQTPSATATPTATNTLTPLPTSTSTPTRTSTHVLTNTPTQTFTFTFTPTRTFTFTPTRTFIFTPTRTFTFTPTRTFTFTPTRTFTFTPTRTYTNTPTRTNTNTPTRSPTSTPTQTRTPIPTSSPVNLALGKTASQSSTLNDAVAGRAVDGITNGASQGNSIAITAYQYYPWWQVDLGGIAMVNNIKIWNRTDTAFPPSANIWIFISNTPFTSTDITTTYYQPGVSSYYISGIIGLPSQLSNINRTGRYIRIQSGWTSYLSLAEVQVLGIPSPTSGK